jgi:hypothetical protein
MFFFILHFLLNRLSRLRQLLFPSILDSNNKDDDDDMEKSSDEFVRGEMKEGKKEIPLSSFEQFYTLWQIDGVWVFRGKDSLNVQTLKESLKKLLVYYPECGM